MIGIEGRRQVRSRNGRTVIGYATRHYERTPTQVFAGQPSRFGAGRVQQRPRRSDPLDTASSASTDVILGQRDTDRR